MLKTIKYNYANKVATSSDQFVTCGLYPFDAMSLLL